jgi:hypothetical protein
MVIDVILTEMIVRRVVMDVAGIVHMSHGWW